MDQIPAAMDRHLEVVRHREDGGILLGASSLTGRYWYGSLWYYENPGQAPDVEKCTAGVQLEAGLNDAKWLGNDKVVLGLDTGGIAVWQLIDNFHTFVQVNAAVEHDNIVNSVSISSNEKKAVSGSHDKSIKIWDLETLASMKTYRAHSNIVWSSCYHPTQPDVFLSCSQDGLVLLWDTRQSPHPARIVDKSPLNLSPTSCAWQSGDSTVIAIGDEEGRIVVKDTRMPTGVPLSYMPHYRPVTQLEFCPQRSNLLASGSEDCTVVVGSFADDSVKQIYQSDAHKDIVHGMSWLGANKLYTCGWDSRVESHHIAADQRGQGNVDVVVVDTKKESCCDGTLDDDKIPASRHIEQVEQEVNS